MGPTVLVKDQTFLDRILLSLVYYVRIGGVGVVVDYEMI